MKMYYLQMEALWLSGHALQVMTCVTEVLAITAVPWLNLLKS
jgi:hypothetical protein